MKEFFYALALILLFFGLLYWNYGRFVVSMVKWKQKIRRSRRTGKISVAKLPASKKIPCYIPFWQAAVAWEALYGSATVYRILCVIDAVLVVVPLIIKFFFPISMEVMLFATFTLYVGLVLSLFLYGIVTAIAARLYEFSWFYTILVFLLPHIFCFYMQSAIGRKMRDVYEEDRFHEHHADTIIKRKPDQRTD